MADMFAEALSKLPQKVIWKLRGKVPQKVPDNVKLMDVIPQNDLLGKCPLKNKNGIYASSLSHITVPHGVEMVIQVRRNS